MATKITKMNLNGMEHWSSATFWESKHDRLTRAANTAYRSAIMHHSVAFIVN